MCFPQVYLVGQSSVQGWLYLGGPEWVTKNEVLEVGSRARQLYDEGFSSRANAIAHNRSTAVNGKIDQRLGKLGPFTADFKEVVKSNYIGIYENPYLDRELKGAKMILRALQKAPKNPAAQALFQKMTEYPVERKEPCLLCPIWRHEYATRTMVALAMRYFFEAVRPELVFNTTVYGFASDLFELEALIEQTQEEMDSVISSMNNKRMGVVITGAFEPDLRSKEYIDGNSLLSTISKEQGWVVPDTGGWVLSGHFLIRAPHHDSLEEFMRQMWPSKSGRRVEFKPLYKDRSIEASILALMQYVFKYTGTLFDTQGEMNTETGAARTFRKIQNAFYGPTVDKYDPVEKGFVRETALRQWALFIDRIGPEKLAYSIESVHAQKWYSESEMEYFKRAGDDMMVHGWLKIEIHRDTGPFSKTIDPKKRHMVPHRKTRTLQVDHDWIEKTDLTGADPFTGPVSIQL